MDECTKALPKIKLNRYPGSDGFSVEFYQTFWGELKEFTVYTFNNVMKRGN